MQSYKHYFALRTELNWTMNYIPHKFQSIAFWMILHIFMLISGRLFIYGSGFDFPTYSINANASTGAQHGVANAARSPKPTAAATDKHRNKKGHTQQANWLSRESKAEARTERRQKDEKECSRTQLAFSVFVAKSNSYYFKPELYDKSFVFVSLSLSPNWMWGSGGPLVHVLPTSSQFLWW